MNYNVSFSKFAPDLRRRLLGRSERQGQDCGGVPGVRGEDAACGVRQAGGEEDAEKRQGGERAVLSSKKTNE